MPACPGSRWQPWDEQVLRRLLPISGVQLYTCRDGRWYRHGRHLPAFDFPEHLDYRPLHAVLTPAPVEAVPPPALKPQPVRLTLVPDHRPRRTTAVACGLAELGRWADMAPAARLAAIRAAHCNGRVLLLGERLPHLPGSERFWGEQVLVPLGYRPEPELPERALREALGLDPEELLVLGDGYAEVIEQRFFQPLSRAQVRLAGREAIR